MASYRGHLAFASALGFVTGGVAVSMCGFSATAGVMAAVIVTIGGLLPDLDSQSGVPVRELFGLAAVFVPLLLLQRISDSTLSADEKFLFMGGMYATIRYGLSRVFKRMTVHRGMFHSIPAMLIAWELIFLSYQNLILRVRVLLGVATMIGFFSHLLLDEIYSVDFRGLTFKPNHYAGSAIKFWSPSFYASTLTWIVLGLLSWASWAEFVHHTEVLRANLLPTSLHDIM